MLRHTILATLAVWVLASCVSAAMAADKTQRPKYVRIERDGAGEAVSLQTAVTRFVPSGTDSDNVVVDLVGAIHVGEKGYYEALNKRFEGYDVVLFEMVAPAGVKIPKGTRPGGHPVAMLQNGLKDILKLEHQLEWVDYSKENMVHADMSPDEFSKSMSDRGESFATMFFRMLGQSMAQQAQQPQQKSKTSDFDLLAALFDKNRAGTLKRIMAEQFEGMEGAMMAIEGPQGSTIVSERNKVALKRLEEQLSAGKKKIAIFYGAAHMPDIEARLADEFGLKRAGEEWVTAWKMDPPPAPKSEARKPAA